MPLYMLLAVVPKCVQQSNGTRNSALPARTEVIMAALCNRAGHYIFALWFLLLLSFFFFPSPNVSGHRVDIYHTSTHGVALVRI